MSEIRSITSCRTLHKAKQQAIKYFLEKFGHEKIELPLTKTIYNPNFRAHEPQVDHYITFKLSDFIKEQRDEEGK